MASIAPMWWLKEVPVQIDSFVETSHSTTHTVPCPRNIQQYQLHEDSRKFENYGGVFAFPNQYAKSVVWRTRENATVLELILLSGKENAPTGQISFRFHAPIITGIHVAALTQQGGIFIMLMTVDSVLYRLNITALSHFLTSSTPDGYASALQIRYAATAAPKLFKYLGDRQAALALTDGSLLLIKGALLAEDTNQNVHTEMKVSELHDDSYHPSISQDGSALHKLRSILTSSTDYNKSTTTGPHQTSGLNILALETHNIHNDTLLFTLHQDRTIRVWSVRHQRLQVIRCPASPNDAGYIQEALSSSSRAHLGVLFNPAMPWVIRLVAYMPTDNDVHLSIYTSRIDTIEDIDFIRGSTTVLRSQSALSPGSSPAHLINWSIIPNENQAGFYIWGVWQSDVRICVKYLQIDDPVVEREHYHQFSKRPLLNGRWWPVAMQMPLTGFVKSMSHVDDSVKDVSKYYADVIFTSGHFSECTIIRALKTLFQDREYTPNVDLESQVIEALFVRTPPGASLVERERIRHREIIGWTRFISYCAKLDHEASRALGLSIALDTGYMVIIKQDSLSFLTACDDSEILYHTFQDKQFEVTQFIASPPSQLRSTYPRLRDQALRHDIAKVFRAIDHLSHNITNESAKNLENTICQLSLTNGPRNFVEILSQEHLPYYISKADMNRARNLVGACKSPADVFRYLTLQLAHSEDTSSDTNQAGPIPHRRVLPYETLVVTSIQQLASSRYTIAQNVLILLATIFSSPRSYRAWVQDEAQLLSSAMRVTQSLMLLKWISNQALSAPTSTSMELEQQLSKMHVDEANLNNPQVTLRERLTASLLRTMTSKTGKISTVEFPIYFAVPRVVSTFLHVIGIRSQRSETEAMYHAGLAQHLSKLNEMKLLAQFLDIVSTASSLSYYRGRVLLSQAKPTQAIEQFMAVITCFGNGLKEVEQELDIMQLDYSTGVIRGHTKLEEYYDNVIRLLVEHGAHEQAITIAKIALSDILHNSKADVRIRSLLEVIIDSALAIGAYDSAFNAMMLLPQDGLKRSALRKFVKIICDNGDGAKLSLFPFNGLQDQVEQLLKSKAEQNAVLSKPDNYKILYSYYIYRCEYKKAATIMCQYARRLCDGTNRTETVWRLLTEAGSAYLAAINALQAADSSNAWVSIELAGVAIEEPSKRRRLNDSLQNPTSSALLDRRCVSVPCKREILQLTDLKQEFQLIKAKLLLVTEIPDEVIPAALTMSARETQLLLVQRGCYEEATSLALMHDLDLDIVFKLLVDKYLSDLRLEQE